MNTTRSQLCFLIVLALVIMPVSGEGNITSTPVIPTTTITNVTVTTVPPTPANTSGTIAPQTPTTLPAATLPNATTVTTEATQPLTGDLFVVSSPAGANLLIDGIYRGSTPVNLTGLAAGSHLLRLTLSGYYDYETSIYVIPGETIPAYGTLPPLGNTNPQQAVQDTPATVPQTPITTVVIVQPTPTSTPAPTPAGILGNPTLLAAIIGVITASLGAAAAFLTHIGKFRKG
ncbi:MAG: PEGA domain-containing protein [Methanoregula sp.]|nr:PEGA domain-containing protein [Methanoregula sp.]